mgnify:CR=1 FL=1
MVADGRLIPTCGTSRRSWRCWIRRSTHASASWHVAAMTFDGTTQRGFADGVEQGFGRGRIPATRRWANIDWRSPEPRVLVQGPHSYRPHQPHGRWRLRGFMTDSGTRASRSGLEGVPRAASLMRDPGAGRRAAASSNVHDPLARVLYAPAPGTSVPAPRSSSAPAAVTRGSPWTTRSRERSPSDAARRGCLCVEISAVRYGHPAPLQDVLRAIRVVRSRAGEFGVRADRIGLDSARIGRRPPRGVGCRVVRRALKGGPARPIDAVSARPDFRRAAVSGRDDEGAVRARRFASAICSAPAPSPALVDRLSIERARPPRHAAVLHRAHIRGSIGADREQRWRWSRLLRASRRARSNRTSTRRARTALASRRDSARRRAGPRE